jgi:hypothetical protein
MMGGYNGTTLCYDDGTHGDDMPGDGIYHYMDSDDQIGCHGVNAPHGEYHYTFWAESTSGQRNDGSQVHSRRKHVVRRLPLVHVIIGMNDALFSAGTA